MARSRKSSKHEGGAVLFGLAGALFVAAGGFAGGYYYLNTRTVRTATHEAKASKPTAPKDAGDSWQAALDRPVELIAGGVKLRMTWRELGGTIGRHEAADAGAYSPAQLKQLAQQGRVPIALDRSKVEQVIRKIKVAHDHAPTNAFIDLEGRRIVADKPGRGIELWAALPRLETAARIGQASIELPMVDIPATSSAQAMAIEDISQVLGTYTTKFSVSDKDRNFNLKLAASKLNGFVLQPGAEFSFNEVVGERSEKMGYKIAHVIDAGEMVDGLAGGTCQISTTLFGASFFAGLEIVKTTNHSRPSTYTPLGFDATVVWPNTDLKLKNPYDFPVVIHYRVANGESTVELLGKKRPWDKIAFERKVLESTPYTTEERLDPDIKKDETSLDQGGFDGYKLLRHRRFYRNGEEVKTEKWVIEYKPVTEYVRRGTSEDPNAKMPPVKEMHGPKAPDGDSFKLTQ